MYKRLALAGIVAAMVVPVSGVAAESGHGHDGDHPDTIDLPAQFVGEGVAVGKNRTFYAGSVFGPTGGFIARGDLRKGTSEVFISDPLVPAATGLKADLRHDLLWVSGAGSGQAAVYTLENGDPVVALTLAAPATSFINDVIVTRKAAYFTNSFAPEIYRVPVSNHGEVGAPETIALSGPAAETIAGSFNLNGIEAAKDGRTLIVVNSTTGKLFTVDAKTGGSALIDVDGMTFPTGDGILLQGRTLYVLQNGNSPGVPNQINVVRLNRDLTEGRLVDTITSPLFETATTLARRGDLLVAVNSQFGGAPIDPESELVLIDRDNGHEDHDD
jgi:sugar lactone lactonase YvrE